MKENINLLPPPAKKARRLRVYKRRVRYVIRRLIVAVLTVAAGLALVFWVTEETKREIERDLASSQGSVENIEGEVRALNSLLSSVSGRLDDYQAWSGRVSNVLDLLPEEARVQVLTLREGGDSFTIQGVSSSRSSIVEFQEDLEALDWVARVEAPLRNFAGPQGEFSFTLFTSNE